MRILLVDDHKMLRDGLRAILERAELQVVGEAEEGQRAISLARELQPDIVIMDVTMPVLNGMDATRRLVAEVPGIKVIGLSMCKDQRYAVAMFRAGAVGYLLKTSPAHELIHALKTVAAGMTYVSPSIAAGIVNDAVSPSTTRITPDRPLSLREREVLQLLSEGKSSKEIAACLDLAVATVETHRRQIMDKLQLRSVAELTKFAIREGLTSVD